MTVRRSRLPLVASKMRSNTPRLAQRRNLWNTVFHLPNCSGMSRQGMPVRIVYRMPSSVPLVSLPVRPGSDGLSLPVRPGSDGLPGNNGSMSCHCGFRANQFTLITVSEHGPRHDSSSLVSHVDCGTSLTRLY